jgi:nucleotide-binding universal stress UspA family protein
MKNKNYKILVLSDLKETAKNTLHYATDISKEIDADIELFYVKKPTEIIDTDNPLYALRSMSSACLKTEKKIKNMISPISEEYGIDIKATFGFGNVKNEIENRIETSKPDLIILGEKNKNFFSFLGDDITGFVTKKYKEIVVIAKKDKVIESHILSNFKSKRELIA